MYPSLMDCPIFYFPFTRNKYDSPNSNLFKILQTEFLYVKHRGMSAILRTISFWNQNIGAWLLNIHFLIYVPFHYCHLVWSPIFSLTFMFRSMINNDYRFHQFSFKSCFDFVIVLDTLVSFQWNFKRQKSLQNSITNAEMIMCGL